jgi:hypothetical protein
MSFKKSRFRDMKNDTYRRGASNRAILILSQVIFFCVIIKIINSFAVSTIKVDHTIFCYIKKGKAVPLQAWTGPEGS